MFGLTRYHREFGTKLRDLPRGLLCAGAVALISVVCVGGPAHSADDARDRVERIVTDNAIQRDLSIAKTSTGASNQVLDGNGDGGGSGRVETRREGRASNGDDSRDSGNAARNRPTLPPIGDPGPVVTVLLWVLVGALAIVVAFHAVKSLSRGRRLGRRKPSGASRIIPAEASEDVDSAAARQLPPDPLSAAEDLARSGNYEDAVHLVLLLALEQLRSRFGGLGRSLTSLEVVRKLPLETQTYRGLSALVALVQLSRFGGRSLDEADYRRSVGSYRDIARAIEPAQ